MCAMFCNTRPVFLASTTSRNLHFSTGYSTSQIYAVLSEGLLQAPPVMPHILRPLLLLEAGSVLPDSLFLHFMFAKPVLCGHTLTFCQQLRVESGPFGPQSYCLPFINPHENNFPGQLLSWNMHSHKLSQGPQFKLLPFRGFCIFTS